MDSSNASSQASHKDAYHRQKQQTARETALAFAQVFNQTKQAPETYFVPTYAYLMGNRASFFGGPVMLANLHFGYMISLATNNLKVIRIAFTKENTFHTVNLDEEKNDNSLLSRYKLLLKSLLRQSQKQIPLTGIDFMIHLPHAIEADAKRHFYVTSHQVLLSGLGYLTCLYEKVFDLKEIPGVLFQWAKEQPWIMSAGEIQAVIHALSNSFTLVNKYQLKHRLLPFAESGYQCVLFFTYDEPYINDKRLQRYAVCHKAMRRIQTLFPEKKQASDLSIDEYQEATNVLNYEERQYILYFLTEGLSITECVESLIARKHMSFGAHLYSTHQSYSRYFQMTNKRMDYVVSFSKLYGHVLGSVGLKYEYDGYVFAVVDAHILEQYLAALKKSYKEAFDEELTYYLTFIEEGMHPVKALQ